MSEWLARCDVRHWHADLGEERREGVDFWVEYGRRVFGLEVKSDSRAVETGNAFIETHVGDRFGWAHTTRADWVLYLLTDVNAVAVRPDDLRAWLQAWEECVRIGWMRERIARNPTYEARGLLVPLSSFVMAGRLVRLTEEPTWLNGSTRR